MVEKKLNEVEKKAMRKRLLVDKKFQTPFIVTILIALLIVIFVIALLIITTTSQQMTGSVYNKIVDLKNTRQLILPRVIIISAVILVIGGLLTLYNLLKYTHRIVGPLVRFKQCLRAMGNGDFTLLIRFRQKDKLKELGDIYSTAVEKLSNRVDSMNAEIDVLNALINDKGLNKLSGNEKKLLKAAARKLNTLINKFKTS